MTVLISRPHCPNSDSTGSGEAQFRRGDHLQHSSIDRRRVVDDVRIIVEIVGDLFCLAKIVYLDVGKLRKPPQHGAVGLVDDLQIAAELPVTQER